jgi:hypothetical protein
MSSTETQSTPTTLSFRSSAWADLFAKGQYGALSAQFLEVLQHFRKNIIYRVTPQDQYFVDQFVKWFLTIFTEPEFKVPEEHVRTYIASNHLIANLVAISEFRTTDAHLKVLLPQQGNFVKILTLLNARCTTKVDRNVIFATQPELASSWYAHYACSYYGVLQSEVGYHNLREHFAFTHPNLVIIEQPQESYFGSTYAGGDRDQIIKPVVNKSIRDRLPKLAAQVGQADPKRIAVVSGLWKTGTSVYRCCSEFIRSLKPGYHLTFFSIYANREVDGSLFDEVIPLEVKDNQLQITPLLEGRFHTVIYPDVGMIDASISLANMRIAPIQIAMLGHSASTFGADIDYLISGAACEVADHPEKNYSERLVLLPDMGCVHQRPQYEFQGLKQDNEVFTLNGLFWAQKINHPFVQTLRKLMDRSEKKIKIRIFPGSSSTRASDNVPFVRDIHAQLGAERVEFMGPGSDYKTYMAKVEEADLTVDSYPFGGCNTVSDSLFARVPMVLWESDKWYGRIGPEMMRRAGLSELVAKTEDQYLDIATRLINDDAYRAQVLAKVKAVNLDATIYDKSDGPAFRRFMDDVIKNHGRYQKEKKRTPIRVRAR